MRIYVYSVNDGKTRCELESSPPALMPGEEIVYEDGATRSPGSDPMVRVGRIVSNRIDFVRSECWLLVDDSGVEMPAQAKAVIEKDPGQCTCDLPVNTYFDQAAREMLCMRCQGRIA